MIPSNKVEEIEKAGYNGVVKDLTGAHITHNHPEGMHDFGFSNEDFSFFTANKLRLLRAVDEKYIHELTTDLFEMEVEDRSRLVASKLDVENVAEYLQEMKSYRLGLKYRRIEHEY